MSRRQVKKEIFKSDVFSRLIGIITITLKQGLSGGSRCDYKPESQIFPCN